MTAEKQFEQLAKYLTENKDVVSSQMFGKQCLKVKGKAFLALHKKSLVFKLSGDAHKKAWSQKDAVLWDPSGKGRPMKEWIEIRLKISLMPKRLQITRWVMLLRQSDRLFESNLVKHCGLCSPPQAGRWAAMDAAAISDP